MTENLSAASELYHLIEQGLEDARQGKTRPLSDAIAELMSELALGQESADKEGWLSSQEVEQSLGLYESLEGYTNE